MIDEADCQPRRRYMPNLVAPAAALSQPSSGRVSRSRRSSYVTDGSVSRVDLFRELGRAAGIFLDDLIARSIADDPLDIWNHMSW